MIDYTVTTHYAQVGDKTSDKFYAAVPQVREKVTILQFAKHIASHGSPLDRGTIAAVLTTAVDCIREMLLDGNSVQLGELGTFYVKFRNELVKDRTALSPANIKKVLVKFVPGAGFEDLRGAAEFNPVPSRKAQAAVKRAEKEGKTVVNLNEKPTGGNQTGGENGITGPTNGGLGA